MENKNNDNLEIEIIDDFLFDDNANRSSFIGNPESTSSNQTKNQSSSIFPPGVRNESVLNPTKEAIGGEKSKKNKLWPILLVIAVIGIIIGAIYIYYVNAATPQQLLAKGIEELGGNFDFLIEPFKNSTTEIEGSKIKTGDVSLYFELNIPEEYDIFGINEALKTAFDGINNTKINYTYKKDLSNEKEMINILSTFKEKKLFDVDYFKINNKHYVFLKDIFDKYIELDELEEVNIKTTKENFENFDYLWKTVKKSLIKNIDESYLDIEVIKVMMNDEEVALKKITLDLNYNNQRRLLKNIFLDLKKDKTAYDILCSYYSGFKDIDIDEVLDNALEDEEVLVSMYFKEKTKTVVMAEIIDVSNKSRLVYKKTDTEETIELFATREIRPTNWEEWYDADGNYIENFPIEEVSEWKATIKKNKEKVTVNIKNYDGMMITIIAEQQQDNYSYSFNIISDDISLTGKSALTYEKVNNDEYIVKNNLAFKIAYDGETVFLFKFLDDGKVSKGAKIDETIDDFIVYSELTEEELEELENKIEKIFSVFIGEDNNENIDKGIDDSL